MKAASLFDEAITLKIGISAISTANALENLDAEIPHWDFEKLQEGTRTQWDRELAKLRT